MSLLCKEKWDEVFRSHPILASGSRLRAVALALDVVFAAIVTIAIDNAATIGVAAAVAEVEHWITPCARTG